VDDFEASSLAAIFTPILTRGHVADEAIFNRCGKTRNRRDRESNTCNALIGQNRLALVEVAIRAAKTVEPVDLVADAAADIRIQVRQADIEVIQRIQEHAVFLLMAGSLAGITNALGRDVLEAVIDVIAFNFDAQAVAEAVTHAAFAGPAAIERNAARICHGGAADGAVLGLHLLFGAVAGAAADIQSGHRLGFGGMVECKRRCQHRRRQ
jgi:hypothetical protein